MNMANMHLVTGYGGKGHITAEDHGAFNAAIFGTGQYVLPMGSMLAATVITNNQIRVAGGELLIQGRHVRLDESGYVDLAIDNGSQDMKRNDLIVARYTKDSSTGVEECNLVVIKGTAVASDPVDPEHTTGDILYGHVLVADMPLYRVPLKGINVQELVPMFNLASIAITDGGVTTTKLKDGAVTTSKLATNAVNTSTIVDKAITTAKLADGAVSDAKLAMSYVPKTGTTMTGSLIAANGNPATAQIRNIYAGTAELTAGETALETGLIYCMYE
jgi:hypothetical protein